LYGSSGAGKTSILRMITGLLKPQKGQITVDNLIWLNTQRGINYSPQMRQVGMVFQDYALFPNMTVEKNLLFALPKNGDKRIVEEIMEVIELEGLKGKYPKLLSKGQQQRVALGRALVQRPKLLLLDEPLSALDDTMRLKLQDYILKVHDLYNLTTILISHDIGEILKMADKVFHIQNGGIIESGSPKDVFKKQTNHILIDGIIQTINEQDNQLNIEVAWNNQLLQIVTTKENQSTLKVGDAIELSAYINIPKITKY